jgi:hypothetical protein
MRHAGCKDKVYTGKRSQMPYKKMSSKLHRSKTDFKEANKHEKALSLVMATVLATKLCICFRVRANNQGKYIPFGYASGATKYATDDDGRCIMNK